MRHADLALTRRIEKACVCGTQDTGSTESEIQADTAIAGGAGSGHGVTKTAAKKAAAAAPSRGLDAAARQEGAHLL